MKANSLDRSLLYVTAILFIGGILILSSASVALSQKKFGSIGYYTLKQLFYGGLAGLILLYVTQWLNYKIWKRLALPMMMASFILLALLFIPELSYSAGGARRWLSLGALSFQPSEILKLSFIIYLAGWLDARREEIKSVAFGLIPFALMLSIIGMFLTMQPDLGTLGIIAASSGVLYFLGGGTIAQIATLSIFGLSILYFLIQIAPYRLSRILVFLNPSLDPKGVGYQISQALIAIGSGGFWGLGFGKSLQKYNYLPEPLSDSIFAVVAEELGFIGALLLISLFGFLFWRGIMIARRAPDNFGKLLAAGISISIMVQAFINMSAISGLLPLTGIPLPFISYGGTSLAVTLASIGILLNISKYT